MAELAWNPRSWDVVVVCAGEEFRGTLSILRRVPFFDAALAPGFSEGAAGRLEVADARIAAFRAVWHYLYTDDCARVAALEEVDDLLDLLSLAGRFELVAVAQAGSRRLTELLPSLEAPAVIRVLAAARLHGLGGLRQACQDRAGAIGADFLLQDGVFDLLAADGGLYEEVVSAAAKRRRTI